MKKDEIRNLYRLWRKENDGRKPNRAIVLIRWDDEPDDTRVDTVALANLDRDGDDPSVIWYCTLDGLTRLTEPSNGSDFTVEKVLEFYKQKKTRN